MRTPDLGYLRERLSARLFAGVVDFLGGAHARHRAGRQDPAFFVPDLPSKPWHDRGDFAWAARIEAATVDVAGEFARLGRNGGLREYEEPGKPLQEYASWQMFYFSESVVFDPTAFADNAAMCPRTVALLATIPRVTGLCAFSVLQPGVHIRAHHGVTNARWRCHLPLCGTAGASMRVADETRGWQPGRLTAFDDSFDHEVWHRGIAERVVLTFDVWAPDLTDEELAAAARLPDWLARQQRASQVTGTRR